MGSCDVHGLKSCRRANLFPILEQNANALIFTVYVFLPFLDLWWKIKHEMKYMEIVYIFTSHLGEGVEGSVTVISQHKTLFPNFLVVLSDLCFEHTKVCRYKPSAASKGKTDALRTL